MTEIPFEVAIQRGLGRVVLMLREQGDGAKYRKTIQYACRNNLVHDPLFESDRDEYLTDVLEASGDLEWHLPRLRKALWKPKLYFHQLALICARLTEKGYADFREELYGAWKQRMATVCEEARFDGAHALLWLDGVAGWQFVQKEVLAHCPASDDYWRDWSFYDDLVEKVGPKVARHAGDSDPELRAVIARFVLENRPRKRRRAPAQLAPFSEVDVWAALAAPTVRPALMELWTEASDEIICAIAATPPTEPEILKRWLRLFWRRAYPLDPAPLLALFNHTDPRISLYAFNAMQHIEHSDVRAFAECLINSDSPYRPRVGKLLAANPAPNDADLLEQVWNSLTDDEDIHDFGIGFRHYHEAQPNNTPTWLSLAFYENCPCSMCRGSFVKQLIERGQAPEWLLKEISWDCAPDTRGYSTAP